MSITTALAVSIAAIFVSMALVLWRLFSGPSPYDRVLAVNSFGTKTVLFIAVLNFLAGRPEFLDIALLYALINFVGTIAILKFFRYRRFSLPMSFVRGSVLNRTKEGE